MHVVIVGGGAALAQPVIEHFTGDSGYGADCYLNRTHPELSDITAVCRTALPIVPGVNVIFELSEVTRPIDVLITMTGAVDNARLDAMTDEQWDKAIAANLTAPFQALRKLLPLVVDNGNVVVVGSIVGSTGGRGCANYAAAKAGLVGLVRAAANEHAARGVCVNLLELGYIDAGMGARLPPKVREAVLPTIPLYRFGAPEDVVLAVDFLARTRYATGTVLTLAGGLR